MRELDAQTVTQSVRQLCIDANRVLPADLEAVIQDLSLIHICGQPPFNLKERSA